LNREVKLVKVLSLFILLVFSFPVNAGERREMKIQDLTPENVKKIKKFHISFYKEKLKKEIYFKFNRKRLTGKIKYYIPESIYTKILRSLSDIDKNNKINGFEKDRIYEALNEAVVKNLNLKINEENINCILSDTKVDDIISEVSNKPMNYTSKISCNFKKTLQKNNKYKFFINDFITVLKGQDRFSSPVKVSIEIPKNWHIGSYSSGKVGKAKTGILLNNIELSENTGFSFSFIIK